MNTEEISSTLLEAARIGILEILEEEMDLESLLSDIPETDVVISIVKKRLDLTKDAGLPKDLSKEQIIDISHAIQISLGEAVSEAFKEAVKQPKLFKALKNLFSAHQEDFGSLDPVLSKRYADVLLNFIERYMETPGWKRTQSLIIIAESLVKNVTGTAKPRLYSRLDVNWGIYLWKCGNYSDAENKFKKAEAGINVLLKKHERGITNPLEITRNKELEVRILMGFGVLYGDVFQDKTKAIEQYKKCLSKLSKLEETYKHKKMKTSILNNLGVIHHKMSEQFPEEKNHFLKEAATYYEEGLNIARDIRFTNMEGWLLFNAGEIFALAGEMQKAEQYSEESRKIYSTVMQNDRGLAGVEMLDAIIKMEKKEYLSALECINRSIELREKVNEPRRIADALDLRGDIRMAFGERAGAIDDYRNAHAIYESIGSVAGIGKINEKLK